MRLLPFRESSILFCIFSRCCVYVSKLEHGFFSQSQNRNLAPKLAIKQSASNNDKMLVMDKLTFGAEEDDETW